MKIVKKFDFPRVFPFLRNRAGKTTGNEIVEEIERSGYRFSEIKSVILKTQELTVSKETKNEKKAEPEKTKSGKSVKIPKLEVRKFDGKLGEWQKFWDSFQSAIDENDSLSD